MAKKPTVAVDFDGVLHRYNSGFQGVSIIPDSAVPGAVDFLSGLILWGYQPAIFSSRSKSLTGRWAMKKWLVEQAQQRFLSAYCRFANESEVTDDDPFTLFGFLAAGWAPKLESEEPLPAESKKAAKALVSACSWPWTKPPSIVTVDDRAIRFDGSFDGLIDEINTFQPWMKRHD